MDQLNHFRDFLQLNNYMETCGSDPWSKAQDFANQKHYEDACYCLQGYLDSFYADPDITTKHYVLWLASISVLCEGMTVYVITQFKGLRQHPMKLYAVLSCSNFFVLWTSVFGGSICQWSLTEKLRKSLIIIDWKVWIIMEKYFIAVMF